MNNINEKYNLWLENVEDKYVLNELKQMDEKQIEEAFYGDLEFGTAGVRGLLGAGSSKMNIYTVGKVTQGLANYLVNKYPDEEIKVALATDPRHMHKEFTEIIIRIMASFGIKVIAFSDVKPTPMLSYLVRNKECQAGIMITASHNPKEYNGYKVYNPNGGQLNLEEADEVIAEVNKVNDIFRNDYPQVNEAIKSDLVEYINEDFDDIYLEDIKSVVKDNNEKDIKIVFTPECGTSHIIMPKAFKKFGFKNIIEVKEQMQPDGDFKGTKSANPEEIEAYDLAIEYAKRENADIILANDPDADRLGVVIKNRQGKFVPLTGNETGVLLIDYLINRDNLNSGTIYKTIVTGELGAIIAKDKGLNVEETLTGFKFIADKIKNNKNNDFIFGYEESYGYLINENVRDKDAIQAALLIAEMANDYLNNDIYLDEKLNELYKEYGYRYEVTKSLTLSGIEGLEKIKNAMQYYRTENIKDFAGYKVASKIDYLEKQDDLPKADVIKFYLADEKGWIVFRPSGTEPKLKIYMSLAFANKEEAEVEVNKIYESILNTIDNI